MPAEAGAIFSPCGTYRYRLWRRWGDGPRVLWIMLNPSTATADRDDPTIRRCAGFTKAWGARGGYEVLNLFALRSTYPGVLRTHPAPVGPDNDERIQAALRQPWFRVMCAWGAARGILGGLLDDREHTVATLAEQYRQPLRCLGTTRAGHPRHPLYVGAHVIPVLWT